MSEVTLEADAFFCFGCSTSGIASADFLVAFYYIKLSRKVASAVKRLTCKKNWD
jgi:hypothetical protein